MRRRVAFVLLAALAVACGGSDEPDTAPDPTAAPTTGVAPVESSVPPTSVPPVTAAPPATTSPPTSPPTTPPPSTIVEEPTEPVADDAVVLGPPVAALVPGALPPTDIDWSKVGPGWLLIDHGPLHGETVTLDQRGLYLVSPDDVVYGVSALPNDGTWRSDVSADGRQVLLQLVDPVCADGSVQQAPLGYAVLDLVSTSLRPIVAPVAMSECEPGYFSREVQFTADGAGVWVADTWFTADYRHVTRVRLSRVEIATGASTVLLDEPAQVDETELPSTTGISVVELDDGRIVVGTRAGAWVRASDGSPLLELDVPHADCAFQRVWDADHLLARCPAWASELPIGQDVPVEQCPASGLWLVPVAGSPAQLLAVPHDHDGNIQCWSGYASAEPLGDELAVGVGGDGCSDDVVFVASDGTVTQWLPSDLDSCTERLLGVRNGAWLLDASSELGEGGAYEVTDDGATRLDLLPGWITVI